MSFSSGVKQEICRAAVHKKCCALAEAYGVLLYCNTFAPDRIRIVTESQDFAERLPGLFRRAFSLTFDALPGGAAPAGKLTFGVTDAGKIARIFRAFGLDADSAVTLHVNFGIIEEECCRVSFLRGAFLAGGSVTDPEKRYHLELATTHRKVAGETNALLLDQSFSPKTTARAGNAVLYFKQSDAIEDFLTLIGAPVSAMAVMEAKVEKDLRNEVNRRVNCDTANITKVVDAAQDQLEAIERLERSGRLAELPEKLRETARLRRENPEATFAELAQLTDPPLTKSAISHRMKKLIDLAGERERTEC
jgi:DNA-binding protein WhiA